MIAFAMTADMDTLRDGSCTSCAVTQDKSAYWHPALYFMHENGDTEVVDQVGGMLAYVSSFYPFLKIDGSR